MQPEPTITREEWQQLQPGTWIHGMHSKINYVVTDNTKGVIRIRRDGWQTAFPHEWHRWFVLGRAEQ